MFPKLKAIGKLIERPEAPSRLWRQPIFAEFSTLNILPLIYDEKKLRCNILVFNAERAREAVTRIQYADSGGGRKHAVYRFYDKDGGYVCEVRYGTGTANALQRGFWTHTKNGEKYFDSVTEGWIDYSHNRILVKLFSHALIATGKGHEAAMEKL